MIVGEEVTVNQYGDRTIRRILVSVEKRVLFVCKREEFDTALRENREPICVGFQIEDLVEG